MLGIMKKLVTLLLTIGVFMIAAETTYAQENYGGVLNTFVKFGDDASIGAHYEIQVASSVTVSPEARIWFNDENTIALGGRADYYFDELLGLVEPWDIWGGVDAGIITNGDDDFDLNIHIGFEYKLSDTLGLVLELGGGSTTSGGIGLSIRL